MSEVTSLAKRGEDTRNFLIQRQDKLLSLLPQQVGRDRFMSIMLSIVSKPEIMSCDKTSLIDCAFGCAKLGLVPDPILGHIYIIPRNMKQGDSYIRSATIQMGYKGFIELGRRSGALRSVSTDIVYDCDEFNYWSDEHGKHYKHIPNLNRTDDADIIAAYCSAEMSGETAPQVEVMPWSDILRIKNQYSDPKNMAWRSPVGIIGMGKKTVIRQCAKLWPQSPELARAVLWDERYDRGEKQAQREDDEPDTIVIDNQPTRSLKAIADSVPGADEYEGDPEFQPEPPVAKTPDQMAADMNATFSGDEPTDEQLAESARLDAEREAAENSKPASMFPEDKQKRPTRTR